MAKRENPYLIIVNPETGVTYAVTEEGFKAAEYSEQGYKVDMWQDGRKYDGSLPKVSNAQREKLGLLEPTPENRTVAGIEAKAAEKEARQSAKKSEAEEPADAAKA
jgi:hypothetical protein